MATSEKIVAAFEHGVTEFRKGYQSPSPTWATNRPRLRAAYLEGFVYARDYQIRNETPLVQGWLFSSAAS